MNAAADSKIARCADMSFMINVLTDRGMYSNRFTRIIFENIYHDWCPHCINAKMRMFYNIPYDLYSFTSSYNRNKVASFPMNVDTLVALIKHKHTSGDYNFVDIEYLDKYIPLNREFTYVLMQKGFYHSLMAKFVTNAEIVSWLIDTPRISGLKTDDANHYLNNVAAFGKLIERWRRLKLTPAEIANDYSIFYCDLIVLLPEVIETYRADLTELFPIVVLIANIYNNEHDYEVRELTLDSYPLDLIERAMAACTKIELYVSKVGECIDTMLSKYNIDDREHINKIARLIIRKYPRYLYCVLWHDLSPLSYSLPELIFESLAHDPLLIQHLPKQMRRVIGYADINRFINAIICDDEGVKRDASMFCTLFDLIQINRGIRLADITADDISKYIDGLLEDRRTFIELRPKNKHSYYHIAKLIQRNVHVVNLIAETHIPQVIAILYVRFWNDIGAICKIARICGLPADVADLIKMFYIKPSAAASDIARMLAATKSE
jgi:hypothetical protein